jgi:hypothetical protein
VAVMGPSSDKQGSTGAKAETVIRAANPAKSSSHEHRPNIDPNCAHKLHGLGRCPEGRWEVVLTLTFGPFFRSHLPSNLQARLTQITLDARFRPLFGWVLARSGSMPIASPATGSS